MTADIKTTITAISTSRIAVKRIIGSGLRRPIGDPQGRRVLVTGRTDALQPFRENKAVRAEIERQRGQFGRVEFLYRGPQRLAFCRVELDFERVDQPVHLRVLEAGGVLAGKAV